MVNFYKFEKKLMSVKNIIFYIFINILMFFLVIKFDIFFLILYVFKKEILYVCVLKIILILRG